MHEYTGIYDQGNVPMQQAETRKQYLAIALRRARPGSGSHPTALQARTSVYPVFDLSALILHTPYVVVGGVATRLYMPERMTIDLDVLVLASDAQDLYQEL